MTNETQDDLTRDETITANRDETITATREWVGALMGWTPTYAAKQLERCDDDELDKIVAIGTAPQRDRKQLVKAVLTRVATREQNA